MSSCGPRSRRLQDLAGKKVNFNTLGTAAAYSGPLIFSRLGIDIDKTFIPHPVALQQMRKGEMAAVVFITSKPVDAFLRGQWDEGFKFLPVAYDRPVRGLLPASRAGSGGVSGADQVRASALRPSPCRRRSSPTTGRSARTATSASRASPTILFSRIDKLQVAGFDAKWKSINLGATVPGLTRFPAAQDWLDRQARRTAGKK